MNVHPIYARNADRFSFEKISKMNIGVRIIMLILLVIPYICWMVFADIFRYLWIGNREHQKYPSVAVMFYHIGFTFMIIWLIWKDPFSYMASAGSVFKLLHDSFSILTPIFEHIDGFLPQSVFLAGYKNLVSFFAFTGLTSIGKYFLFYLFSGFILTFALALAITFYWPLVVIGLLFDGFSGRMPFRDVIWDSVVFVKDTFTWNGVFIKDFLTLKENVGADDYMFYDNDTEESGDDFGDLWSEDEAPDTHGENSRDGGVDSAAEMHEEPAEKTDMKVIPGSFSDSIDEARAKLDRMIGLQDVKDEINTLLNTQIIHQARSDSGLKSTNVLSHMVFVGNPGSGKTSVARILGDIYRNMGLLRTGVVVETARQQLVGAYIGETAIKTEAVVKKALGGILFIDEAYTLAKEESANDFGQEAIDTLLKMMEDHRGEFIVIVAGYQNEMQRFITSNPGLRSRFQTIIHFTDYTASDLRRIFALNAQNDDYTPSNGCMKLVSEYLEEKRNNDPETFANGRDVRNIYQQIVKEQSNRLVAEGDFADKNSLQLLKTEDARKAIENLTNQIF